MTRKRRTTTAATHKEPTRFPTNMLAYLEVAVEGPLGPGGIAHRRVVYPVTRLNSRRGQYREEIIGAACGPTTTEPGPDHATNPDDTQVVPVTVCRSYSAAYAQLHGVTRCVHDACFPTRPEHVRPANT
jgi:hypothetical protein